MSERIQVPLVAADSGLEEVAVRLRPLRSPLGRAGWDDSWSATAAGLRVLGRLLGLGSGTAEEEALIVRLGPLCQELAEELKSRCPGWDRATAAREAQRRLWLVATGVQRVSPGLRDAVRRELGLKPPPKVVPSVAGTGSAGARPAGPTVASRPSAAGGTRAVGGGPAVIASVAQVRRSRS